MKTTHSADKARKNNIKTLETMVAMLDQNLKGAKGSERVRLQDELGGVRAQLKALGA